jgi:hypothetical protein
MSKTLQNKNNITTKNLLKRRIGIKLSILFIITNHLLEIPPALDYRILTDNNNTFKALIK